MSEELNFRKNKQFWLLCLSTTLFFSSFNMLLPELPEFLRKLGGSEYIGLHITFFTITALIARPFSGKLTDTIGRIPVMIIGATVGVLSGFLYPLILTVSGFLFVRFLHGFSTGFKPTATSAFVADIVSPMERGIAMGYLGLFTSLGMAIGPIIGPHISAHFGLNTLFFSSSAMAFLSVAVIFGMKETLPNPQKIRLGLFKVSWNDFFEIRVLPVAITFLLSLIPFGIVLSLIPDLSDHLQIPNRGIFFTIFVVSSLVVRLVAGKVSDKYGRIPVLILGTALLGISMILIAYSTTPTLFYTASTIFGFASGMNGPTVFAWNIDRSHENHRGRAMATLYIFLEFGIGFGAMVSGWIYGNEISHLPAAFIFGSISAFLATLYLLYLQFIVKTK
jgi:MFS family permease